MGCDGGTIPKRDELVKTKKKPEQKDKSAELAYRWKHCAVSQEALQKPVVACELGRLYNKDTIIETLLDKSAAPSAEMISHVKNLRDVKEINLTENPAWIEADATEKGDAYIDNLKSKWICPITGQEMNGRQRFVLLWICGCVFSERSLKEMTKNKNSTSDKLECLKCQKPFEMNDVILLNAEEEDLTFNQEKMERRRAKAKELKNLKKSKKEKPAETATSSTEDTDKPKSNGDVAEKSSSSSKDLKRKGDLINGDKIKNGNGILKGNEKPSSSKKIRNDIINNPDLKEATKYSVANDPKASKIYKGLFTSSEAAKTKPTAFWVTYDPRYN